MKKIIRVVSFILILALSVMIIGCGTKTEPVPESSSAPASASSSAPVQKELDWPKKSIQIIVPYKAGGDTDFNARTYAKYLEKELGQSVAVVNVDGAGGTLGSRKVKDSAPDGYTVLMYHSSVIINEITGMVDYGFDDFEMAFIGGKNPGNIFAVRKDQKWNNLKELMEDAKANPGKIKLAADTGGTTSILALLLNDAAVAEGGSFNIVDAGSSADRNAAVLGGHIDIAIQPYGVAKSFLESGEFKSLGLTAAKRTSLLPSDLKTCKDQGYDVALDVAYFFAFPKGTPKEIVEKFSKAGEKIATTNKDYAADIGKAFSQEPVYMNAEDATKFFEAQREVISKYKDKLTAK